MSIRVALRHITLYRYSKKIRLGAQVVRLRPAPHSRTTIVSYTFRATPGGHFLNWQQDPQGNFLARLVFPEKTDHLEIDVELLADLKTINPFEFFLEPTAEKIPFSYDDASLRELGPYLEVGEAGPLLQEFMDSLELPRDRTIDTLVALNQRIQKRVDYVIRMEPGVQTPEETLGLGRGSCRDSAWLLVQVLRRLGIAARFASGYLIQLRADQKPIDGPAGPEADFTDLHAWAEAYLPGAGWVGFDATSGLLTAEGHVPLACTPDPASAAPISGTLDECETDFSHRMEVRRVRETPRVTLPYSEEVWGRVESLGHQVDRDLIGADVRLTMGGEPTFVSIDDPNAHEWNYGALGEDKRRRAGILFRRLADRFAKDPLLHYGLGKWYPGEQLPRWALGCYFRKDGESIWREKQLIAEDERDYGVTSESAEIFVRRLVARLELARDFSQAAYEDPFVYMLKERRLPSNLTPLDNRLDDELERLRVARIIEQGLGQVVGYALPLAAREGGGFRSGPWFLRRELLYLIPGDSPMGLRLPVDSLPWVLESDYPYLHELDPFDERRPLPPYAGREPHRQPVGDSSEQDGSLRQPRPNESASWITRTSLCVEPRAGILHVFLPPMPRLEDYLSVVSAVEGVARELGQPVRIEGYTPPPDDRLTKFSVTPDPGVIEVNLHPAASWDQLVSNTRILYQEAREARLGTEKFLLDGRHVGTGGGNHLTLGASRAVDSPLFRRPDLLGSLVGYWHDHPALSYLFSGLFIGPTSQAPRVDEARHEASYELETALAEARRIDAGGGPIPPWLVDRIFRNLLADVTGNTHRTEFCIDKLFSPDSASGRQGILEMRAFEMPPHPEMSLAQMLLVRALVARFWKRPYRSRVVRWGTTLHDKFMLPHFVWQDFHEVLGELRAEGYPLEDGFFEPHFEFRFPVLGSVTYDSVELELRRALEPWHVLAEEGSEGGTVRSVDSSLDRIQVRLRNAVPGRHAIACNGARVPLRPTGVRGEAVAGVRFRAWHLPSNLHPTVGVHAPLHLSLVDRWLGRAIGGCTLAVGHPGGVAYDKAPVNASEAEARRGGLFAAFGHAPGELDWSQLLDLSSPDYPNTLDLRRLSTPGTDAGQLW